MFLTPRKTHGQFWNAACLADTANTCTSTATVLLRLHIVRCFWCGNLMYSRVQRVVWLTCLSKVLGCAFMCEVVQWLCVSYFLATTLQLSDPLPAGALDGVTVTMSEAGESCDTACKRISLTCSVQHFNVINSCDRLREHVACEAGCEAGALPGGSSPVYMEPTTPKAGRPAMCFVSPLNAPSPINCGSKDTHAQRLCPCKSA